MLQVASSSSSTKVVVQLDNKQEQHFTLANFCVANARYFGGGMKIAPDAKLDDGQFDVISIGDLGAARIMTNAPRIYTGTHLSMQQVNHTLAKKSAGAPGEQRQHSDARHRWRTTRTLAGHLPDSTRRSQSALSRLIACRTFGGRSTVLAACADGDIGTVDADLEVCGAAIGDPWIKAKAVLMAQLLGDKVKALLEVGDIAAIETAGRFFGELWSETPSRPGVVLRVARVVDRD